MGWILSWMADVRAGPYSARLAVPIVFHIAYLIQYFVQLISRGARAADLSSNEGTPSTDL
jgi:hypothetical protein